MESQQQTKHPVAMFLLGSMLIEVQTQRPLTLLLDDLSSSFGKELICFILLARTTEKRVFSFDF